MADRKIKGKAVSSSSQVPRFKILYHEAHYNSKLSARKVLPELIIQVDESILDPCGFQIQQRKWERFTKPIQAVGYLMVREFYANAWEPDKEKRKPYTYTTMVRGKDISFAPSNIKRVLKLRKDPIPNAASYHERKANKDYRLDHVLEDLCIIGADWVRHKDGRPHYLRRADLEPMKKEEIIADKIYKFVYKTDVSSSLPFPSIIAALCTDAKIPAIPDDTLIPQEPPIIGVAMTRTRETRARNPRPARQGTLPQQQPPQEQPQPQFHHQQDFPSNFYTHFDASMQFKEMEMQGIPVTMANLALHRQKEKEMNQERMRYDQILQEAAAQQARETNKGKAGEVVPDSEKELASSASEEW
ncbi:hypothetical protein PIB30_079082 [Stylosanthes scabra]|uniref:Putative plant transposon protein domain-containing protein n=1 Tax=Stylosanthes scabra TaxID=79078 RepID=A0ABU6VPH5_9FABA|nr:hypothetical protein [Stylosanthes scabra]